MSCELHTGVIDPDGYPRRGDKHVIREVTGAREGQQVHHMCGVRACVSIHHLLLVTPKQHGMFHRRSHCRQGHRFSGMNKRGDQICSTCPPLSTRSCASMMVAIHVMGVFNPNVMFGKIM